MNKTAVVLVNIGTPDSLSPGDIKRYLREFLSDARVVTLPTPIRWLLVNALIVPTRYKQTMHAYETIWTENGSPLLGMSKQMKAALQYALGESYHVDIAMRYGNPSIKDVLSSLSHYRSLIVIPLYPQYSSAATGSSLEAIFKFYARANNIPSIKVVNEFYSHDGFISGIKQKIESALSTLTVDRYLFSYHGLPEHHVVASGCHSSCDRKAACPAMTTDNQFCYRAQCFATTRLLAAAMNIDPTLCVTSFQSRLGRTPWIKPYTDQVLQPLYDQGVRNLAVISPSFIVDCLETLEEINIRLREQWLSLSGTTFHYVPCLNDSNDWIQALANLIKQ